MKTPPTNPSPEQPTPRTDAPLMFMTSHEQLMEAQRRSRTLERELAEAQQEITQRNKVIQQLESIKQPIADEEVRIAHQNITTWLEFNSPEIKASLQTLLRIARQSEGMEKEHDEEIGEFQNQVRDLLMKLIPGCNPDGAGCDSGDWRDFTLCEISQGIGFMLDHLNHQGDVL